MAHTLSQKVEHQGYNVSEDVISEAGLSALETDISPNVNTPFASVEIGDDEFYRVGQGEFDGADTQGEFKATLDNGSGTAPSDQMRVNIVKMSSNDNVQDTLKSTRYRKLKNGIPLQEIGPIYAEGKLGLVAQADSSTYSVSLADSDIDVDVVRGER